MVYVMLPHLQVVLFFVCFIVETFERIFMRRLAMGCVIINCTTIILNAMDKVANIIKFRVVEGWST